jgi:hypothetical protein
MRKVRNVGFNLPSKHEDEKDLQSIDFELTKDEREIDDDEVVE